MKRFNFLTTFLRAIRRLRFIGLAHRAPTKNHSLVTAHCSRFVTDSTGKKFLWNKQQQVVYKNDTSNGRTAIGYAVCATDDGGFTVVGKKREYDSLGGTNTLVAHFVPKPISAVIPCGNSFSKSINGFNIHVAGSKLIVNNNSVVRNNCEAVLFDLTGRQIAAQAGKKEIVFDISHLS